MLKEDDGISEDNYKLLITEQSLFSIVPNGRIPLDERNPAPIDFAVYVPHAPSGAENTKILTLEEFMDSEDPETTLKSPLHQATKDEETPEFLDANGERETDRIEVHKMMETLERKTGFDSGTNNPYKIASLEFFSRVKDESRESSDYEETVRKSFKPDFWSQRPWDQELVPMNQDDSSELKDKIIGKTLGFSSGAKIKKPKTPSKSAKKKKKKAPPPKEKSIKRKQPEKEKNPKPVSVVQNELLFPLFVKKRKEIILSLGMKISDTENESDYEY